MTFLSSEPSLEPDAISARSISPVDKWHTQNFSFNKGALKKQRKLRIYYWRIKYLSFKVSYNNTL